MAEKNRIVVVDDDERVANLIRHLLTNAGYQVDVIIDSTKAFGTIKAIKPDLAILDVMMPQVDGFTICADIRKEPELTETRVAILSAKTYEVDKARAKQLGADLFIEKPFDPGDLVAKVKAFLGKKIRVRFWGTRGSIPSPGHHTLKYGGNTSCLEVRLPNDQLLIFDAGTGIRSLGNALTKEEHRVSGSIFLTHPHWDHIQGLPFFTPSYQPGNDFTIYGAEQPDIKLEQIISAQMQSVFFPVNIKSLGANIRFCRLGEEKITLPGSEAVLSTIYTNHPGFTLAFCLTLGAVKLIYMTDNEMDAVHQSQKRKFVEFVKDATVLIHDAQYTEEEYSRKKGWGHSSWPAALDLALAGKVKTFYLFHHDPDHSDELMDSIVESCRAKTRSLGGTMECIGAQEGSEIQL